MCFSSCTSSVYNGFYCSTNLFVILRFVRGKIPGLNTGFDVDEGDLHEMRNCHGMVVASAIFGKCILFSVSVVFTSSSF